MAVDIVRGALFIDGWAVAREGIATVEIDVDGQYVRAAHQRADAATAFGDADAHDFHALVPAWALSNGQRRVRVTAQTTTGLRVASEFSIRVEHMARATGPGVLRRKMPLAEIQMAERVLARRRRAAAPRGGGRQSSRDLGRGHDRGEWSPLSR
jgi:hypothetical protein